MDFFTQDNFRVLRAIYDLVRVLRERLPQGRQMTVSLLISTRTRRRLCPLIRRVVVRDPDTIRFLYPNSRQFGMIVDLSIPKFVRSKDHGGLLSNVHRRLRREARNVCIYLAPRQGLVVAYRNGQALPRVRIRDPLEQNERRT